MTKAIEGVTAAAVAKPVTAAARPQKKPVDAAAAPVLKTTVTLSKAALAASAASKEVLETPAQTAQEARGNDRQAQRLLAKEEAAAKH